MNGTPFKLGTFAKPTGGAAVALILDETALDLAATHAAYRDAPRGRAGILHATDSLFALLKNWDADFPVLQELVAFVEAEGVASARFQPAPLSSRRALAPVRRPGKMFYAAQNFQEHVDEMLRAGMAPTGPKQFTGEKATTRPYLFLKASSCLAGATDDIALPLGMKRIDWEAELALAIGRPAKRVPAERALAHIAGFMTTNDVSCRDLQIREDRPGLRSDWLGGKCHDNFAPMGPFFVPRAFVPNHHALRITLSVNGVAKQDGNTADFIFAPEEQIEYASRLMTIESGDIFVAGTCGGVGQGSHSFLKAGDIMETEVEGLGRMRNRFIEDETES